METIWDITSSFDAFFEIKALPIDPAMGIFFPKAYSSTQEVSKTYFVPDFLSRCNGLMLRGDDHVHTVFLSAFPHEQVLTTFINQSQNGDLLFLHHPLVLDNGNTTGKLGRGFLPIPSPQLDKIREKKLSIYSCHAPLDYNVNISTGRSICNALGGKIAHEFLTYGNGNAGILAAIEQTNTQQLARTLKNIFDNPIIDVYGDPKKNIRKVAIIPGGGDSIAYMNESKLLGADAYITGDLFSRFSDPDAKKNSENITNYIKTSDGSFFGVSHAASEFLVLKNELKQWISLSFAVSTVALRQTDWWN